MNRDTLHPYCYCAVCENFPATTYVEGTACCPDCAVLERRKYR